jgi:hypothetical protein
MPAGAPRWRGSNPAVSAAFDAVLPPVSDFQRRIRQSQPQADTEAVGTLASAVARLRRQTTTLGEISTWPGLDRGA